MLSKHAKRGNRARQRWARPRSFAGLMALYESNYRRLQRLLPELDLPFEQAVSHAPDDRDLHLRVLERCPYTLTLHLTYWFEDGEGPRADPDLAVRVYRDAGLAEAIRCDAHSRYAALAGIDLEEGRVVSEQWQRNLLLNKWLAFCLQQGHGFGMAHRPRLPRDG